MTDPADIERYRLPEEQNRRIFQDEIVPELLAGRARQHPPTVVFLVGQPGAGKSRLTEVLAARLNQHGGFVDIDSDLYKPYHPDYDALMARDDTLMAALTRADGRAWMAQAEDYVRTHGLHAIVQETSQNADAVAEKMSAYRDAGARVETLFMAVPQAMSNQGIIARYFEQLADRGHGRLTVQANADESYLGILALADRLDREPLADLVGVYRRGEAAPRYSNSLDNAGAWTSPPGLRHALETERARPWTAGETDSFLATQHRLRQVGDQLGPEWSTRLHRIDEQAAPLLAAQAERGAHADLDRVHEAPVVEAERRPTAEMNDSTAPTAPVTTAQRDAADLARHDVAAALTPTPSPRPVIDGGPHTDGADPEERSEVPPMRQSELQRVEQPRNAEPTVETDAVELEQQHGDPDIEAPVSSDPATVDAAPASEPRRAESEVEPVRVEEPAVVEHDAAVEHDVEQLALLEVERDVTAEVTAPTRSTAELTSEPDPGVEQARSDAAAAERERQERARVTLAEARRQAEAADAQRHAREAAAVSGAAPERARQSVQAAQEALAEQGRREEDERREQLIRWHEQDRAAELDQGRDDGPSRSHDY